MEQNVALLHPITQEEVDQAIQDMYPGNLLDRMILLRIFSITVGI